MESNFSIENQIFLNDGLKLKYSTFQQVLSLQISLHLVLTIIGNDLQIHLRAKAPRQKNHVRYTFNIFIKEFLRSRKLLKAM